SVCGLAGKDCRVKFFCVSVVFVYLQYFHFQILSNMFYKLTDCPTREKAGWTNDAQSSCEQILTNFEAENLLTKWLKKLECQKQMLKKHLKRF
ncbi:MAG: hypothetical protein J6V35_01200, partial [Bacteroidales bacterium]|nr:hypothetical protein [Bacteroidales bacterium]